MNFIMAGRINSQIKNMKMEIKWNEKKKNSDIIPQSPEQRYIEEWREQQKARDTKLETIYSKLRSGKELNFQEMQYLEQKNPQAYQKAKAVEMEKEGYEKALKRCKTKEDVERLKLNHVSSILSNVKEIMSNPIIPESKKLELVMQEHCRMESIKEATQEFVESGRYHDLPTEAEKNKAEKDISEAGKAEREEGMDTENTEETDKEKTKESEHTASNGEKEEPPLQKEKKDSRLSRIEAEQTPEAKKLKLAEARRNYQKHDKDDFEELLNWNAMRNWKA